MRLLGQKIKTLLLIAPWAAQVCMGSPSSTSPMEPVQRAQTGSAHAVSCITGEKYWALRIYQCKASGKQACLFPQRKTLPHPSRLLSVNTTQRYSPGEMLSGSCILGIPTKTCRSVKDHRGLFPNKKERKRG